MSDKVIRFKPGYYKGVASIIEDPKSESEIIIIAPNSSGLEKYLRQRLGPIWSSGKFRQVKLVALKQKDK